MIITATERRRDYLRKLVFALVVANLAAAFVIAPVLGSVLVGQIGSSAGMTRPEAQVKGATQEGLDPLVFRRIRGIIPVGESYWIDSARRIRSEQRQAFSAWASGALLPRIAVGRAQAADWVITWGYNPRRLGLRVDDVSALSTGSRASRWVYVARVTR